MIRDARIDYSAPWVRKHKRSLEHVYGNMSHFDVYYPAIAALYEEGLPRLSQLNQAFIQRIAAWMGIETPFVDSSALHCAGSKSEKLVRICESVGATRYVSGLKAAAYLDKQLFADHGIEVVFHDHGPYPEYNQPGHTFDHFVSIVDLLFCEGDRAPEFIWGAKGKSKKPFPQRGS